MGGVRSTVSRETLIYSLLCVANPSERLAISAFCRGDDRDAQKNAIHSAVYRVGRKKQAE